VYSFGRICELKGRRTPHEDAEDTNIQKQGAYMGGDQATFDMRSKRGLEEFQDSELNCLGVRIVHPIRVT